MSFWPAASPSVLLPACAICPRAVRYLSLSSFYIDEMMSSLLLAIVLGSLPVRELDKFDIA